MNADTVVGRQVLYVDNGIDNVPESSLMEHGSLGLARRARGVDHVGKSLLPPSVQTDTPL